MNKLSDNCLKAFLVNEGDCDDSPGYLWDCRQEVLNELLEARALLRERRTVWDNRHQSWEQFDDCPVIFHLTKYDGGAGA